MNNIIGNSKKRKALLLAILLPCLFAYTPSQAQQTPAAGETSQQTHTIIGAKKINPNTVEIKNSGNQIMTFDFYGDNIFRLFQDNNGGILRDPEAKPEAKILVEQPRKAVSKVELGEEGDNITITTGKIKILLDKKTSQFKIINLATGKIAVEETQPIQFAKNKTIITLKENPEEYFYGGGVQNGRFSHKGKNIAIENQNSWTDGRSGFTHPLLLVHRWLRFHVAHL